MVQVRDCQNSSYSLSAVKIVGEDGCIEPTETMELYSGLPPCLCEQPMGLYILLFCDVHIDIGVTLNILQCLHVSCWILSHTIQRHLISYANAMSN